jgi:hypothetical protein
LSGKTRSDVSFVLVDVLAVEEPVVCVVFRCLGDPRSFGWALPLEGAIEDWDYFDDGNPQGLGGNVEEHAAAAAYMCEVELYEAIELDSRVPSGSDRDELVWISPDPLRDNG